MTKSKILKYTEFINELKKLYDDMISTSIFLFTSKIQKSKYESTTYVTFQPIMVRCYMDEKCREYEDITNAELKIIFGNNFGVKFSVGKNKEILDSKINTLYFKDVTVIKKFKGYDYYPFEIKSSGKTFVDMLSNLEEEFPEFKFTYEREKKTVVEDELKCIIPTEDFF